MSPPLPEVVSIYVALDKSAEMDWLKLEGIPIIGDKEFLSEPHVLVSLRDVYKTAWNIPDDVGLGLARILHDTIKKEKTCKCQPTTRCEHDTTANYYETCRNHKDKEVKDPFGNKRVIARDRFKLYQSRNSNGNPKWKFENSHDACNDAVATLISLLGAIVAHIKKQWTSRSLRYPIRWPILALDCEGNGKGRTRQYGFAELRSEDVQNDTSFQAWMKRVQGQ
jgi:hypothetical protein